MSPRRVFNIVGPFVLALGPLLTWFGSRLVTPTEVAIPWPSGVVALTDRTGALGGARVLDPVARTVTRIPIDLVVQPPNHGETRIKTLFATGKYEEIRSGLEQTLGQSLPFLLVVDRTGTLIQENLGDRLDDARSALADAAVLPLETRRILRPDGTYSEIVGDQAGTVDPLSQIDPGRVFVRVLFTNTQRAASSALANALLRAGFTLVERQLVAADNLPVGVTVRYRLDPVIADAVAAAIGEDARIEEARDPSVMRGADALVLVN